MAWPLALRYAFEAKGFALALGRCSGSLLCGVPSIEVVAVGSRFVVVRVNEHVGSLSEISPDCRFQVGAAIGL
jgi:hypothetical protein